jgi:hypothetical protein
MTVFVAEAERNLAQRHSGRLRGVSERATHGMELATGQPETGYAELLRGSIETPNPGVLLGPEPQGISDIVTVLHPREASGKAFQRKDPHAQDRSDHQAL